MSFSRKNFIPIIIIIVLFSIIGYWYFFLNNPCNPPRKEVDQMLQESREAQKGAARTPVDVSGETVKIFILFGQSNMVGRAQRSEFHQQLVEPDPRSLRLEDDGWYIQEASTERENGPEISLLYFMNEHYPEDKFGIIKVGIGATGIRAFSPDWNYCDADILGDGYKGPLYELIKEKITLAKSTCKAEFVGVVMKQGGKDMNEEESSKDYLDEVEKIITAIRRDTGTSDLPFFVCTYFDEDKLLEWGPEGLTSTSDLPVEAHKAFGDRPYSYNVLMQLANADEIPDTYLVIHGWKPVLPDGLHFTTLSQELFGRDISEKYIEVIE